MADAVLDRLLSLQSQSGAFPSTVEGPDGSVVDETCFVTAQVALLLIEGRAGVTGAAAHRRARAIERALDFVETCAADDPAGAFCFYPPGRATPRLDIALPPDADDTALAWLALMAGGRRTPADARAALSALIPRLEVRAARRGDPPFARAPLLRTWFAAPDAPNPVDLIVNINMLAALAAAGCSPEFWRVRAARLRALLPSHQPDRSELRSLAPYYADGAELAIAGARAARFGVADLAGVAGIPAPAADPLGRPLYCNAHGRPIWRAPALQLARRWLRPAFPRIDTTLISGGSHDVHAQIRLR